MKKTILFALILFTSGMYAQMVPEEWEQDLEARHPKATGVNWIPGDGIYTVEFQEGDRQMKAIYSQEGKWLKSIMQILISEVPEEIMAEVPADMKVVGASKVISAKGREGKYILDLKAVYNKKGELVKDTEE